MEPSDWINLIAAIIVGGGTLFLGIMAWRTIRQTRNIQKVEERQKLLNEIIKWATDVIANWQNIDVKSESRTGKNINENLFWSWRDVSARSYSVSITAKFFSGEMCSIVEKIDSLILDVSEWIQSCRRGEVVAKFPKEIPTSL